MQVIANDYCEGIRLAISSIPKDNPDRIALASKILANAKFGSKFVSNEDSINWIDRIMKDQFAELTELTGLIKKSYACKNSGFVLQAACVRLEEMSHFIRVIDGDVYCRVIFWLCERLIDVSSTKASRLLRVVGENLNSKATDKLLGKLESKRGSKTDSVPYDQLKWDPLIDALLVGKAKKIGIRRVYSAYIMARDYLPEENLTIEQIQNRLKKLSIAHEKAGEVRNQLMTALAMKMGYDKATEWAAHNLQKCIVGY